MEKQLVSEIDSHLDWLVNHLVKKGHKLKDVDMILKTKITHVRHRFILNRYFDKLHNQAIANITGFSLVMVETCVREYWRDVEKKIVQK